MCEETYEIIKIIGYILAALLSVWGITGLKIKRKWCRIAVVIWGCILGVLFHIIMNDFVQVPQINYDTVNTVKQMLTNAGLKYVVEGKSQLSYEEEIRYIVKYKNPDVEGKYVRKGTVIELTIDSGNPILETVGINMPDNNEIYVSADTNDWDNKQDEPQILDRENAFTEDFQEEGIKVNQEKDGQLTIEINSWNYVDSFTKNYKSTNFPGKTLYVEYGKGIAGTFSFSRELTEYEINNWGHTGDLYDSEGNNVRDLGYKASYWSIPEGEFAIELPENLPSGKYTYELVQVVGDNWITATMTFEY